MTNRLEQLKRHEGEKLRAYKCTANHWTIGVGYNLDANPLNLSAFEVKEFKSNGITVLISNHLAHLMLAKVEDKLLKEIPWLEKIDEPRQTVLINMAYNMGVNGLLAFKQTLEAVRIGDFELAASNMLNSKWAKQVHGRADELARQMQTGKYA